MYVIFITMIQFKFINTIIRISQTKFITKKIVCDFDLILLHMKIWYYFVNLFHNSS